jgi:hypothetical protein
MKEGRKEGSKHTVTIEYLGQESLEISYEIF